MLPWHIVIMKKVLMTIPYSVVVNSAPELLDVDHVDDSVGSELGQASVEALRQEQLADETLVGCWPNVIKEVTSYETVYFFVLKRYLVKHMRT